MAKVSIEAEHPHEVLHMIRELVNPSMDKRKAMDEDPGPVYVKSYQDVLEGLVSEIAHLQQRILDMEQDLAPRKACDHEPMVVEYVHGTYQEFDGEGKPKPESFQEQGRTVYSITNYESPDDEHPTYWYEVNGRRVKAVRLNRCKKCSELYVEVEEMDGAKWRSSLDDPDCPFALESDEHPK